VRREHCLTASSWRIDSSLAAVSAAWAKPAATVSEMTMIALMKLDIEITPWLGTN